MYYINMHQGIHSRAEREDQSPAGRTERPAGPGGVSVWTEVPAGPRVPAGPGVPAGTSVPAGIGVPALRQLTQHSEPPCNCSIHLIQDENNHQIDDGRCCFDCQLHVAARDGIGTHVEGSFGRDPVKNDSEHDGKRNADLCKGA